MPATRDHGQVWLEVETADAMVDGIDDYKLIHVGDITRPTRGHVPQSDFLFIGFCGICYSNFDTCSWIHGECE